MSPFQTSPGAAVRTAAERIRVCRTFPGMIARRYDEPVIIEPPPKVKRPSIACGHIGPSGVMRRCGARRTPPA